MITDVEKWLHLLAPLIQVGLRDRILVIGSGNGVVCRWLAQRTGEGMIVGLEPSPDMVREARALSAVHENILYVWALPEQIPWQENFFTLALFIPWTESVEHLDRTLGEIGRVLEPGGRVWIANGKEDWEGVLAGLGFQWIRHEKNSGATSASNTTWISARKPIVPGAANF